LTPVLRTPSRDGDLRRGDFEFHYVEWDVDGEAVTPPILLLHGLSSNARYWDRVAAHLERRRLVALDLTPADPADAAMAELMADIAHAIDALGLARRARARVRRRAS
jgi:pimeloyl-ACP methyl ester carboxylesterase